jgi:transcriptional regulator GlxA family with amidase domain
MLGSRSGSCWSTPALTRTRQLSDAVVAGCQTWISRHYHEDSLVTAIAALSGLPERTFKRRFAQAIGMPPLEYVQALWARAPLRLEEAKRLLETSGLPLDEIASRIGYEDATFLGHLFRRKVGLTPAQYRKRFRALRNALEERAVGRSS